MNDTSHGNQQDQDYEIGVQGYILPKQTESSEASKTQQDQETGGLPQSNVKNPINNVTDSVAGQQTDVANSAASSSSPGPKSSILEGHSSNPPAPLTGFGSFRKQLPRFQVLLALVSWLVSIPMLVGSALKTKWSPPRFVGIPLITLVASSVYLVQPLIGNDWLDAWYWTPAFLLLLLLNFYIVSSPKKGSKPA